MSLFRSIGLGVLVVTGIAGIAAVDSLYYVRAVQEATPTINGGNLRCEYDENGQCIKVNPCYGNELTGASDDCLAPSAHRAWSSPIFVDFKN